MSVYVFSCEILDKRLCMFSLSLHVVQFEQCRWVALEILPGTEQHEKGDREDGVSQISLRSGWIDWIWSACGHIVCARVNLFVWLCACRVVSLQVDDTSYWTSGVMGTCSLRVPIGHLFTHPYCKHTYGFVGHSESPSCSVSQYPHSSPKQINTSCFHQLDYSSTCHNLYLGV